MIVRLGADPEVFLCNGRGTVVSVIDRVGGTKENPLQIEGLPPGFTVQEDNVALEFGIPPASSKTEWVNSIKLVMASGLALVKPADNNSIVKFSKLSCTLFPSKELTHPLANIFGCDPDYNAWTGVKNPRAVPPEPNMRAAGGHIHVETEEDPRQCVKALDLFIGVPSVLADNSQRRQSGYGKAGSMRYKPYGLEYRTPSNYWIFDEKTMGWIWDQAQNAISFVMGGRDLEGLSKQIQSCINTGNKLMAEKIMSRFNIKGPSNVR